MKKTSNFRIQLLILVIFGIGCSYFLFTRQKVILNNSELESSQKNDQEVKKESHQSIALTDIQQNKVDSLLSLEKKGGEKKLLYPQLAQIYFEASDFEKSGSYLEELAKASPSAKAWNNAGDAYSEAFNLAISPEKVKKLEDKARLAYNNALKIEPENLYSRTKLAMTYVISESPMKAIMMLRQVLEEAPNYEPALMSMGALSLQSRQFDKAEIRFRQVLANNPKNLNAKLGLAYSLMELGNKVEAKKIFQELKSEKLSPAIEEEVNKALESLK